MFKNITQVKRKADGKRNCMHPLFDGTGAYRASNPYAHPIDSSRAVRKCRKLAKKNNCTYMEAGDARIRRVGF